MYSEPGELAQTQLTVGRNRRGTEAADGASVAQGWLEKGVRSQREREERSECVVAK